MQRELAEGKLDQQHARTQRESRGLGAVAARALVASVLARGPDGARHRGEGPRCADNRIGIPVEERAAVFLMFKRLHSHDAFGGGSGMGLSIASKIVERHGGRMWIETTPGGGTTVAFTLAPA